MARRKDKLKLMEELSKLEKEGEKYQNKIKKVNDRKEEIKKILEQMRRDDMYQAVVDSGMSEDEFYSLMSERKKNKEFREDMQGM